MKTISKLLLLVGLSGCAPLTEEEVEVYLERRETAEQYSRMVEDLVSAADPEFIFTAKSQGDADTFMDDYYESLDILDKAFDHGKTHNIDSDRNCGKYYGNGVTHRIGFNFESPNPVSCYAHEGCHGVNFIGNHHQDRYAEESFEMFRDTEPFLDLVLDLQDNCGLVSFYTGIPNQIFTEGRGAVEDLCLQEIDIYETWYNNGAFEDYQDMVDSFIEKNVNIDCEDFYMGKFYPFHGDLVARIGIGEDQYRDILANSGACEYKGKVCAEVFERYNNGEI